MDQHPNPSNQPLPSQVPPPSNPPMPTKSPKPSILPFALTVFALGCLTVAGVFAYQNYQLKQSLDKTDTTAAANFLTPTQAAPTPTTGANLPSDNLEIPADWKVFNGSPYSFKYPPEATITNPQDFDVVTIYGPTQKDETEFYDGLNLQFSMGKLAANQKLIDVVKKDIAQIDESYDGELVKPLETITIGKLTAYTYVGKGLGTFRKIYVGRPGFSDYALIVDGTSDPTNQGYQDLAEKILSTFTFTGTTNPSPTKSASTANAKKITYSLPSGWQTIQDPNHKIEVGYNPATQTAAIEYGTIIIKDKIFNPGQYISNTLHLSVQPYNGGSRHKYLYEKLGEVPSKSNTFPDYKEIEYIINGKNCLVLDGISISQWPTIYGMCPLSSNQAFGFNTWDKNIEPMLQTVKFL